MNGFAKRYLLKIGWGFAAAAVSFTLTLHFTGAPVTYSKFTDRAANHDNAFTVGKWSFCLTFQNGDLTVPQTVYESVYSIADMDNAILYVTILLDDGFDVSKIIADSITIEHGGQSFSIMGLEKDVDRMTVSLPWNKISHWFESGEENIEVTVKGNCNDGYSSFSSTGMINRNNITFIITD